MCKFYINITTEKQKPSKLPTLHLKPTQLRRKSQNPSFITKQLLLWFPNEGFVTKQL